MNRQSMGSRAGTSLKNNLGGGLGNPQSRLGTAGRVFINIFREELWVEESGLQSMFKIGLLQLQEVSKDPKESACRDRYMTKIIMSIKLEKN